ncbi:hypothetical protein COK44_17320 [Bacillus cereus]|nr:hypothetical protein COK44_17320 [Bacillus cereus]
MKNDVLVFRVHGVHFVKSIFKFIYYGNDIFQLDSDFVADNDNIKIILELKWRILKNGNR